MPDEAKTKKKKSKRDGYPRILADMDRVMMSARRGVKDQRFLAEFLNSMSDWHDKIKLESKKNSGGKQCQIVEKK